MAQKIATIALVVLALIAGLALLTGQRGSNGSPSSSPSGGFTAQTYASGSSTGASASSSSGEPSSGEGAPSVVSLPALPSEAARTVRLIDAGGPFPYPRDGIVFLNNANLLPRHPKGWYHEYTVRTPGVSSRGARRIITGKDGTLYYTGDHYRTFRRVER